MSFGETMVLMDPVADGPLEEVDAFEKRIGGAESNFAVGISRLGHEAGWISRLGADPFGRFIESVINGEGVDTSRVRTVEDDPTGVMFKERREKGDPGVYYYRHGSAASQFSPEEVPESYIKNAAHLHVTGITPALSEACTRSVERSFEVASKGGTRISFDPNIREALWNDREPRSVLVPFLESADVVMLSEEEGRQLLEDQTVDQMLNRLVEMGVDVAAVTRGEDGSTATDGEEVVHHPGYDVEALDSVGAGDAFAAGFVSGLTDDEPLLEILKRANLCGALATTVSGDMEGLPTRKVVTRFKTGETEEEEN